MITTSITILKSFSIDKHDQNLGAQKRRGRALTKAYAMLVYLYFLFGGMQDVLEASSSSALWQHGKISDMQIAPSQSDVKAPWELRLHSTNCPSACKQSVHPATVIS